MPAYYQCSHKLPSLCSPVSNFCCACIPTFWSCAEYCEPCQVIARGLSSTQTLESRPSEDIQQLPSAQVPTIHEMPARRREYRQGLDSEPSLAHDPGIRQWFEDPPRAPNEPETRANFSAGERLPQHANNVQSHEETFVHVSARHRIPQSHQPAEPVPPPPPWWAQRQSSPHHMPWAEVPTAARLWRESAETRLANEQLTWEDPDTEEFNAQPAGPLLPAPPGTHPRTSLHSGEWRMGSSTSSDDDTPTRTHEDIMEPPLPRTAVAPTSLKQVAEDASLLLELFSQRCPENDDDIDNDHQLMFDSAADGIATIKARLRASVARRNGDIGARERSTVAADCIICYSESADTVFIPCTHLVVCTACCVVMGIMRRNEGELVRCPVCRTGVEETMKIFRC